MSVTRQDVREIALLARLGIEERAIAELAVELNSILAHMDVLQRVDVSGLVPPAIAPSGLRPDVNDSVSLDRGLSQIAPEFRDGFFLVPRLTTHDASAVAGAEGDA